MVNALASVGAWLVWVPVINCAMSTLVPSARVICTLAGVNGVAPRFCTVRLSVAENRRTYPRPPASASAWMFCVLMVWPLALASSTMRMPSPPLSLIRSLPSPRAKW